MGDIFLFIKSKFKGCMTLFVGLLFKGRTKIIISSTGRSGSTMVFNAVSEGVIKDRFGVVFYNIFGRFIRAFVSTYLEKLPDANKLNFVVYKNHEPYDAKYNDTQSHLYVFVYGDPLDSALSVSSVVKKRGVDWFYKHQKHLKGSGSYENIYKKDVLNYENIMHSWVKAKEHNIICIDYCDLWDKEDVLSAFLGFNVKLPERVERSKKEEVEVSQELFSNLRKQKEHLKSICRSPLQENYVFQDKR